MRITAVYFQLWQSCTQIRDWFVIPFVHSFCGNLVLTKANFSPQTAKVLLKTRQLRTGPLAPRSFIIISTVYNLGNFYTGKADYAAVNQFLTQATSNR